MRFALRRVKRITAKSVSHSHVGENTFVAETFVIGLGSSFRRSVTTNATVVAASSTSTTAIEYVRATRERV
jgi:hypothetical protein